MGGVDYRLLVTGPAGAGKSTLIARIGEEFGVRAVDVRNIVIEYLTRNNKGCLIGDELKEIYRELVRRLPEMPEPILEISNDWPKEFFEDIVTRFFRSEKGKMLYVTARLETCLQRVAQRDFPTPESTVRRQYRYGFEWYEQAARRHQIPIIQIKGEQPFQTEFERAKEFLNL